MAINTAQRRLATITIAQPYMVGLVPDGTISDGDRQAISLSYDGILSGVLIIADKFASGMLAAQHVRRSMRRGRGRR